VDASGDGAGGRPLEIRPSTAYALVVLLYLVAFLGSTTNAVLIATGRLASGRTGTAGTGWGAVSAVAQLFGWGLGAVALALLVAGRYAFGTAEVGLRPATGRGGRRRDVDLAAVVVAGGMLTTVAMTAIASVTGYATRPAGGSWVAAVLSLLAGPVEELSVLAVPVLLLRAARQRLWRIAVLLLALRLSYHVYYGWPSVAIVVWGAVALAVYWRTGRLLPVVIAHSGWDLSMTALSVVPATVAAVAEVGVCFSVAGLGLAALLRRLRRPAPGGAPGPDPGPEHLAPSAP
jgi:hypothetical protein